MKGDVCLISYAPYVCYGVECMEKVLPGLLVEWEGAVVGLCSRELSEKLP